MSEQVIVFTAPNRHGVFHTRECEVVENRDGNRSRQSRESIERLGYTECSKCRMEYLNRSSDNWRKSLKQMIKDGEVETV
jgi:hypothetical protein